jgi:hypothetical protein
MIKNQINRLPESFLAILAHEKASLTITCIGACWLGEFDKDDGGAEDEDGKVECPFEPLFDKRLCHSAMSVLIQ